jgi:probable HAF family extracellular repeat protein
MKRYLCSLIALALFLGSETPSKGQPTYAFTTIDVPGASFPSPISAIGINGSGQIVGNSGGPGSAGGGFLFDQGIYTMLEVPGSQGTSAYGINDAGQIVGSYADATGFHGFLLVNGNYTTIDPPGSTFTEAHGINNAGQIVGWYWDAAGTHGFLFDQGSYTTLDVPGAINGTNALGINASGQIVGSYDGHGFLLDQGSYTTLDLPGSTFTEAHGINDSGQIVGSYHEGSGDGITHGFSLDHDSYTTLDVPGFDIWTNEAYGINNSGQIVGYYAVGYFGPGYGFLLENGSYTTFSGPPPRRLRLPLGSTPRDKSWDGTRPMLSLAVVTASYFRMSATPPSTRPARRMRGHAHNCGWSAPHRRRHGKRHHRKCHDRCGPCPLTCFGLARCWIGAPELQVGLRCPISPRADQALLRFVPHQTWMEPAASLLVVSKPQWGSDQQRHNRRKRCPASLNHLTPGCMRPMPRISSSADHKTGNTSFPTVSP